MSAINNNREYIIFPSSVSLLFLGILSAIIAPLVGAILGLFYLRRPQLAREGKYVLGISIVWAALLLFVLA